MDTLKELIRLITKKRIKKIELFDESNRNKTSNYYKLFNGLHLEKYRDDLEAAKDIYDCEPSEKKYLILKTRLKQKLLNTLFFLEPEEGVNQQAIVYDCHKNLYAAKILLLNQATDLAVPLLEKTLKRAEEYELVDIAWECVRILRTYYSNLGQHREFLLYKEKEEQIEERMMLDNLSDKYYQELMVLLNQPKSSKINSRQIAENHYKVLETKLAGNVSNRMKANFYQVKMLFHQFSKDFPSAIETATLLESFITEETDFFSASDLEKVAISKMKFYLQTLDFEKGIAYFNQNTVIFGETVSTLFQFRQIGFLLAMYTGNYNAAGIIFQQSAEHPAFRELSEDEKEIWRVFQFYLSYLHKSLKIGELKAAVSVSKTKFLLSDYQNIIPEFNKRRRSENLLILAVQTLFYLEKMETEAIAPVIYAMQQYCRRYPKKDEFFRSECFVSLLDTMQQENFRFYQTRRSSERIFEEMRQEESEFSGKVTEILPYETIWNIILDKLKSYRYG
jgi:sulfur relay (sulfurtransferase) DsrC/TusE family protein